LVFNWESIEDQLGTSLWKSEQMNIVFVVGTCLWWRITHSLGFMTLLMLRVACTLWTKLGHLWTHIYICM
jgi:hypothetical protein